jgi:hypothetical protein
MIRIKKYFRYVFYGIILGGAASLVGMVLNRDFTFGGASSNHPLAPDAFADFQGPGPGPGPDGSSGPPGCNCSPAPYGDSTCSDGSSAGG